MALDNKSLPQSDHEPNIHSAYFQCFREFLRSSLRLTPQKSKHGSGLSSHNATVGLQPSTPRMHMGLASRALNLSGYADFLAINGGMEAEDWEVMIYSLNLDEA